MNSFFGVLARKSCEISLLLYFKTDSSFKAYSLEMMVNVAQNEILLSEREAQRAIWSQTVNWKGGPGKNMEADLKQ